MPLSTGARHWPWQGHSGAPARAHNPRTPVSKTEDRRCLWAPGASPHSGPGTTTIQGLCARQNPDTIARNGKLRKYQILGSSSDKAQSADRRGQRMSKIIHSWIVSAGVLMTSVGSGMAANDCRLAGAWVTDRTDEIYTFEMIRDKQKRGSFSYKSQSQNLSYTGEYSLEDNDAKLHLTFDGHNSYFKITMSPPGQPAVFELEGDRNPAMPQGPQKFQEQSRAARILSLSLCNP